MLKVWLSRCFISSKEISFSLIMTKNKAYIYIKYLNWFFFRMFSYRFKPSSLINRSYSTSFTYVQIWVPIAWFRKFGLFILARAVLKIETSKNCQMAGLMFTSLLNANNVLNKSMLELEEIFGFFLFRIDRILSYIYKRISLVSKCAILMAN